MERVVANVHRIAPTAATESGQRRWLEELQSKCSDWICAQDALARRILELRTIEARAYHIGVKPMSDAEASEVCESVAAIDSRGALDELMIPTAQLRYPPDAYRLADTNEGRGELQMVFPIELQAGRPTSFGEFIGHGTCVMNSIGPLHEQQGRDPNYPSTTSEAPESEDELHLLGWGGSETLLGYRGRYYVATYDSGNHGVKYLEWLTPAGGRRGLCTFDDDGYHAVVRAQLTSATGCNAFAKAADGAIAIRDSVDLDGDGKPESIGFTGEDSGAGCGHSWRGIKLLTANGVEEASARNDALKALSGIEGGEVLQISLAGRNYVYAERNEVPTVFAVTNEAVVPQCELHIQYKRVVRTQFTFVKAAP